MGQSLTSSEQEVWLSKWPERNQVLKHAKAPKNDVEFQRGGSFPLDVVRNLVEGEHEVL